MQAEDRDSTNAIAMAKQSLIDLETEMIKCKDEQRKKKMKQKDERDDERILTNIARIRLKRPTSK